MSHFQGPEFWDITVSWWLGGVVILCLGLGKSHFQGHLMWLLADPLTHRFTATSFMIAERVEITKCPPIGNGENVVHTYNAVLTTH